jgi:Flp pilus assembly protein TadD
MAHARASKRARVSSRPSYWPALVLLIALAVAGTYAPVRHHDFINVDDPQYVFDNPHVRDGLSGASVAWAFTTNHAGNWHPLTWLSHMADVEVHGLSPGGHHLSNVILHAANTVILFLALVRLTGAAGPSLVVAALFGLHPLRVESVAWIAERKDVLSGLFWMLALLAYARYAARPSSGRYLGVALACACGLMSKPSVVTLPIVLLLLDFWPLQRSGVRRLVLEKVPLLAMSAATAAITLLVQQQGGAVRTFDALPLGDRLSNAVAAYVSYLWKAVWPTGLAPLYPYERAIAPAGIWAAALGLALITALLIHARRKLPFAAVGWGWYLVTLVPMIGLIQVGSQSMADRYTYLPMIGITVAVVWGLRAAAARAAAPAWLLPAASCVVIATSAFVTRQQLAHWRDGVTIWRHTVAVTDANVRAGTNLGHALGLQGRWHEALPVLEHVVRLREDDPEAQHYLGQTLAALGRHDSAVAHLQRAVGHSPEYAEAHGNLAISLATLERFDDALVHFREAARLNPASALGRMNLATALNHAAASAAEAGRYAEAVAWLEEAIALQPSLVEARMNLGAVHMRRGDVAAALGAYRAALDRDPGNADLQRRIALIEAAR